MLDLTLDTSTDPHFLILSEGEKILSSKFFPHLNNLSAWLVPEIENLLKENQATLQDLSRIFVGVGPGSYTGVRVAVAVASSLALALNLPLYPFCSLLAFIPENLPGGPFTYIVPSNHSTNFLLHGFLKEQILLCIEHELVERKDLIDKIRKESHLISLSPEKVPKDLNFQVFKGKPNLLLLLTYLKKLKDTPPLSPTIYYLHQF